MHAHSAFPDEGVFRLAVVSSLFPRLAADSRAAYRAAFGVIAVLLVVMAAAGLQAPVIAVSALAVPLLFLIYLYEVDPTEARFAVPTAAVFVTGAALGVAWGLVAGPVVSGSLIPQLAASLTTSGALASAVAVPVAGQLLMLVPVAVARLRRPDRSEALGGFTAGVVGALGLTMAATLTELGPLLRAGNLVQGSSVLANLTEAVIRGVSVPLVAAAATGYVGAALWSRRGAGSAASGRWFAHPLAALAVALVVQIGLGFADDAGLPHVRDSRGLDLHPRQPDRLPRRPLPFEEGHLVILGLHRPLDPSGQFATENRFGLLAQPQRLVRRPERLEYHDAGLLQQRQPQAAVLALQRRAGLVLEVPDAPGQDRRVRGDQAEPDVHHGLLRITS